MDGRISEETPEKLAEVKNSYIQMGKGNLTMLKDVLNRMKPNNKPANILDDVVNREQPMKWTAANIMAMNNAKKAQAKAQ